jgi:hypothetical protein
MPRFLSLSSQERGRKRSVPSGPLSNGIAIRLEYDSCPRGSNWPFSRSQKIDQG